MSNTIYENIYTKDTSFYWLLLELGGPFVGITIYENIYTKDTYFYWLLLELVGAFVGISRGVHAWVGLGLSPRRFISTKQFFQKFKLLGDDKFIHFI